MRRVELVEARRGIADRVVALTFDDGPAPWTEPIAEALERHGGRGTFFAIGEEVATDEGRRIVRRLVEAGHEVGNHTWTHADLQQTDDDAIADEMRRTSACLPSWSAARSTAGAHRSSARTSGCARRWATSPDGRCGSPRCPATGTSPPRRPLDGCSPTWTQGDIVVLHDGRPANEPPELSWPTREATVEAVALILEEMSRRGLRSVTVSELLASS